MEERSQPASQNSAADRAEIERICRERGLPLTAQRRVVFETLRRLDHPTVDQIWEAAQQSLPEISRTTVYRILETFAAIQLIRKVCHPGAVARYEDNTQRHHHLLCRCCGRVTDFEDPALDQLALPGPQSGYQLDDYSVLFEGLCFRCLAAAKSG